MDDTPVALVAGAETGPGRSVAMELRRAGWCVAAQVAPGATAAGQDAQDEEGGAIEDDQLFIFEGDLAVEADRERFVEEALEQFERIDMLVGSPSPAGENAVDLLELSLDRMVASLSGDALATMLLAHACANEMIRLIDGGAIDGGKIILLGSVAAYTTSADQGLACLNAATIAMAARLLADRLGQYGINVYEIRCGLMDSGPQQPGFAQYDRLIREGLTPLRRWGRSADIARAVSAIAADELAFSTGQVINVDGGFHLRRL